MKNVQISQELFIRLVRLLVFEFDEDTDLIKKELVHGFLNNWTIVPVP